MLDPRIEEEFAEIAERALDEAEHVDCEPGEVIIGLKLIEKMVAARIAELKEDAEDDE